ncbi:microfibrillar-associated protein, putative [Entamoeba invadens IP1]|uniref:Microfibrillar-associated protein, putative n=1 Tax=Entamoeba invadens IP1 TaxID=370355 RepID=A0A0A1TV98_ENTIV|nr:microfibrillar-associated protein, putative [Entamoeba invadens IP1]ELP84236.1 microfibrillar-associated protein, putative [Entamoeba invadens IP1]|eukprot:XP_004183582.1 microfibrillar-associated protein, putative [Entamoeba invadens IP1]
MKRGVIHQQFETPVSQGNLQINVQDEYSDGDNSESSEEEVPLQYLPHIKQEKLEEKLEKVDIQKDEITEINRQAIGQKLVELALQKEEEQKKADESTEEFTSGEEYGGEDEYKAWELREWERVKKEYLADLEFEKDLSKLVAFTKKDDSSSTQDDVEKRKKKQWKFLQKYYHIGSFFLDGSDWDVTKGKWDFDAATGNDWMDKTLLPKVLQTRDWGKKGRAKHTTLLDEDTSRRKYE